MPAKNGGPDYDKVLFSLMQQFYPSGMLGVGLTALVASFMSGMAGNVTAFNTVWTYDIYQSYIRQNAPDSHYLWMGRMATIFGTILSIGAAYLARAFNNMMDFLQLIFGFVNAPLFATFLLGMFWKRATANGAFAGLVTGTSSGRGHLRDDHCGRKRRLARRSPHVPLFHGAELLGGHQRLRRLLLGNHRRQLHGQAPARLRIGRPRIRRHPAPGRSRHLVQTALPRWRWHPPRSA